MPNDACLGSTDLRPLVQLREYFLPNRWCGFSPTATSSVDMKLRSAATRYTIRAALVLLTAIAIAIGCGAPQSTGEPFAPSLPPSAVTSLFGGQTGSDESTSPCVLPSVNYQPDQQTSLGISGNDAAGMLTSEAVLRSAERTTQVSFTVSHIEQTSVHTVEPGTDGGECKARLQVVGTGRLEARDGSFESSFPLLIVATSRDSVSATNSAIISNGTLFEQELATTETQRVFVTAGATWRGWVTAYDEGDHAYRALADMQASR
jgi:hypothetical protein